MTELFNTSINIHSVKKNDITIDDCLNELYRGTLVVKNLTQHDQKWYLTGYSRKDASKHVVFNGNELNQNTIDIFERHYRKNQPLVNESIWNGQPDGLACSISHFMKFIDNPRKLNLIIDMDQRVISTSDMIDSLLVLAEGKNKSWIKVDSKGYWRHDHNVFPDRIYVGWMLYLPHIVLPELIPEAAKVVPVFDDEKQKGTIVVSTEEIFDGGNADHIGKANDIEIRLLDLGLLPLMTEL
ncbi:Imm52 family immunity protein [Kluyvera intermedia]|uniref:Imm52 family immunity protein n=1 Tax=Kluyvera intermedia TaxID=61648 RepID=UPI00352362C4